MNVSPGYEHHIIICSPHDVLWMLYLAKRNAEFNSGKAWWRIIYTATENGDFFYLGSTTVLFTHGYKHNGEFYV